jgi:hypothetical protein
MMEKKLLHFSHPSQLFLRMAEHILYRKIPTFYGWENFWEIFFISP